MIAYLELIQILWASKNVTPLIPFSCCIQSTIGMATCWKYTLPAITYKTISFNSIRCQHKWCHHWFEQFEKQVQGTMKYYIIVSHHSLSRHCSKWLSEYQVLQLQSILLQADILMVSDGEIPAPSDKVLDQLQAAKEDLNLEVHALLVGGSEKEVVKLFASHIHHFRAWDAVKTSY